MNNLRSDLAIISEWISPGSRVLDMGCGDGTLLAHLKQARQVDGYGLEIAPDNIVSCIDKGVNVIQTDLDAGISDFFDENSFDYVVMTQTLQAMIYPDRLLKEMLRVGREGIVTFPNFGHWRCRLYLATRGRMPVSKFMPYNWYDTPNIHFCTVTDFEALCAAKGIRILGREMVGNTSREPLLARMRPNLFAVTAIYHISR